MEIHQSSGLAANERPGAGINLDVKVKSFVENIFAQQAVIPRIVDGFLKPLNGKGIFRADVDVTFLSADGISGDGHTFEHRMRIAFHDRAVHKSSGVTFVTVADRVLRETSNTAGTPPI